MEIEKPSEKRLSQIYSFVHYITEWNETNGEQVSWPVICIDSLMLLNDIYPYSHFISMFPE